MKFDRDQVHNADAVYKEQLIGSLLSLLQCLAILFICGCSSSVKVPTHEDLLKEYPTQGSHTTPEWGDEVLKWHALMVNERGGLFGLTADDAGQGQGKCFFPQKAGADDLNKDIDDDCKKEKREKPCDDHRNAGSVGISEGHQREKEENLYDTVYLPAVRNHICQLLFHASGASPEDIPRLCQEFLKPSNNSQAIKPEGKKEKKKLLIFVHGGLNDFQSGLDRAVARTADILRAGYYPIFINWDSNLWHTYREHVLYVRQGQYHDPLWNRPGLEADLPYVFSDLIGGLAKLPLSVLQTWKNDYEGSSLCPVGNHYSRSCGDNPTAAARYLNCKYKKAGWNIRLPENHISLTERLIDFARATPEWILAQPTRSVVSPALVQGGSEAWNNMLRRIDVAFRTDGDFLLPKEAYPSECRDDPSSLQRSPTGALALFFQELVNFIQKDQIHQWEITLVGHSMGSILLNRVIRRFGENLPISHIVYMGSASTIKDYEETVWPYIRSRRGQIYFQTQQRKLCEATLTQARYRQPRDAEAEQQQIAQADCRKLFPLRKIPHFYNLMLHPKAEAQEASVYGIVPRGSLLVWLDGFLTNPPTLLDRMLGRFTNFMETADRTPPDIAKYIHPKVFGLDTDDPQNHGDFSEKKFWKKSFWKNSKEEFADSCLDE